MAIIKCKMCGGDLVLTEGSTVAECEYCGTVQTVPVADNEKKLTLFARANRLRYGCEFDKAAGVYEAIVAEFPEEAEAYWGLVLCKYGIEYVDDPATGKKIPTCHRSSFDSVTDDNNYDMTLEYADVVARRVYREEAKTIEQIRKGIIEVSSKEDPYDIFICYKETEIDSSERTLDSVLAQDVYDALTEKGYRVFFSRITLEDKLGVEYEPYIFAALNSAKIMLAFGTDYEHYNAVWVKNEWSRYLKLMAEDRSKHLIPCYKDIDIEDMPKEFRKLQAQDLGKVGATQDLLRGIEKILPCKKSENTAPTVVAKEVIREIIREQAVVQAPTIDISAPLQRGWDLLESGEWEKADAQFDRVLEIDGRSGMAYAGKLCARFHYRKLDELSSPQDKVTTKRVINGRTMDWPLSRKIHEVFRSKEYLKAMEYADAGLRSKLEASHKARQEHIRREEYYKAESLFTRRLYQDAITALSKLDGYWDSAELIEKCKQELAAPQKDGQLCARLAQIRKRNAPMQRYCVSNRLVGADGKVHGYWADKWAGRDGLVSSFSVEFWPKGKGAGDRYWFEYGLSADGQLFSFPTFGRDIQAEQEDPLWLFTLSDIVSAVPCRSGLVALDKNGVVHGLHEDRSHPLNELRWENIVQITAGPLPYNTTEINVLGLRADGTVVALRDQAKYAHWIDIAALSVGSVAYAITNEGHAVTIAGVRGSDEVFKWKDLVAMTDSTGLCADGTVVSTFYHDTWSWKEIVAICEEDHTLYGIRADGMVLSSSKKEEESGYRLFNSIDTLQQERIDALEAKRNTCLEEIARNKGLFRKKERQKFEGLLAECEQMIEFQRTNWSGLGGRF